MLRLYISYAPADKPYLDQLLLWLKPLQEKYFLRIWHNPMPRPFSKFPYQWDAMLEQLGEAHIYLFLMSHKSIATSYIEQEETPRAVERYIALGKNYIRIFPVLLSPSHWDKHSSLAGFAPIGLPGKTLADLKPDENGYLAIVRQLELVIVELRRNWMEEKHRLEMPIDEFDRPGLPPPPEQGLKPIPGWAAAALLFAVFYLVTSWYFSGCAPKMYHLYAPESLPYQPPPQRYYRDNPVQYPEEVPLRPNDIDSAAWRVQIRPE